MKVLRMFSPTLVTVIATLLLLPAAGSAQARIPAPLLDGDRVRVTLDDGRRWTGRYHGQEDGHIVLQDEGGNARLIPVADTRSLELSRGKHRRFVRTLGITVGVAAGAGGLMSAASWEPCTGWCLFHPGDRSGAFALGAAAGALVGAPLGALLGLIEHERWSVAALPEMAARRPVLSVAPAGDGRVVLSGSVPVEW